MKNAFMIVCLIIASIITLPFRILRLIGRFIYLSLKLKSFKEAFDYMDYEWSMELIKEVQEMNSKEK